ncbi:MAG: hypothetical protein AAGC83_06540 [Pseudomonadota bacterium]
MFKTLALSVVAGSLFIAGSATAQDTPGEETFYEMNKAVAAATKCSGVELSRDQHNVVQSHIAEAAGEAIGPGKRLTLIRKAKDRIHKLSSVKGCGQAEVAESLALYESDLAGLL